MAGTTTTQKSRSRSNSKDATAKRVKTQLDGGITQVEDTLEKMAHQTALELRKVGDQSSNFVRENPVIAVAGAFGAGVLIGLTLRGQS